MISATERHLRKIKTIVFPLIISLKRTCLVKLTSRPFFTMSKLLSAPIKGVLLDITGVLYNSGPGGGTPIEGSVDAVKRLKDAGLPVRFVTNETQCTREQLVKKLAKFGFSIPVSEIFQPAPVVRKVVEERQLRPFLLIHPGILEEFNGINTSDPNCVVVGDADEHFSFANVNFAFQTLMKQQNPVLLAMGKGKYYRQGDELQIDLGAFVAALEYSCDIRAEIFGKPSPQFFKTAIDDMGAKPEEIVMIGDDIIHDVGGSQKYGLRGVLVRTGKFRPSDENHEQVKPDAIVDNLAHAVNIILSKE